VEDLLEIERRGFSNGLEWLVVVLGLDKPCEWTRLWCLSEVSCRLVASEAVNGVVSLDVPP
jgi:hypothetical protein